MKKRTFLLFLIFTLFLLPSINNTFNTFASGAPETNDSGTGIVKASWLYVSPGYYDTGGLPKKIAFSSGGEDLINFTTLGVFAQSEESVTYWAKALFGFEVTAHTFVGAWDPYPEIDPNRMHEEVFFGVGHGWCYPLRTYINWYSVKWNSIDFGNKSIVYEYANALPITVGIKKLTERTDSFELNGITIQAPDIKADVVRTIVSNVTYGTIGNYTSEFEDLSEMDKFTIEFVQFDDFSETQQEIIDYYENADLGIHPQPIKRGATLMQSKVGGDQIGSTYHNPNPADNEMYTFDLDLVLAPEVFEWVQYNQITKATIMYIYDSYAAGLIPVEGPLDVIAPKRVVGLQSINNYIHWDLIVEVYFYANLIMNAELSQMLLTPPFLDLGDVIFDSSIIGDQNLDIPITPPPDPWDIFGGGSDLLFSTIIAVVGFIGVIYVIGKVFPGNKRGSNKQEVNINLNKEDS